LATEIQRVYKQSGYQAAINRTIEIFKQRRKNSFIDAGWVAEEYGFLGDKEPTLEWLEKAYQEKSDEAMTLRIRRCYDFLRSDPRYKDLERRIGYAWKSVTARSLGLQDSLNMREYFCIHPRRKFAGLGILLAWVIDANQQ
jgi:hypothetical protein